MLYVTKSDVLCKSSFILIEKRQHLDSDYDSDNSNVVLKQLLSEISIKTSMDDVQRSKSESTEVKR